MALADSLVFNDMVATIILVIIITIMMLFLIDAIVQLSINDYYASMSMYLFHECITNNLKPINYTHIRIIPKVPSGNRIIICPIITYDTATNSLNVSIYTAIPG